MSIENEQDPVESHVPERPPVVDMASFTQNWQQFSQSMGRGNGSDTLSSMGLDNFTVGSPGDQTASFVRAELPLPAKDAPSTLLAPTAGDAAATVLISDLHSTRRDAPYGGKEEMFLMDLAAGRMDAVTASLKGLRDMSPAEQDKFLERVNPALQNQGLQLRFGGTTDDPNRNEIVLQRTLETRTGDLDSFRKTENLNFDLNTGKISVSRSDNKHDGSPVNVHKPDDKLTQAKQLEAATGRLKDWMEFTITHDEAKQILADGMANDANSAASRQKVEKMVSEAYEKFGEIGVRKVIQNLEGMARAMADKDPDAPQNRVVLEQTDKGYEIRFQQTVKDPLTGDAVRLHAMKVDVPLKNFTPNPDFDGAILRRNVIRAGIGANGIIKQGIGGGGGAGP